MRSLYLKYTIFGFFILIVSLKLIISPEKPKESIHSTPKFYPNLLNTFVDTNDCDNPKYRYILLSDTLYIVHTNRNFNPNVFFVYPIISFKCEIRESYKFRGFSYDLKLRKKTDDVDLEYESVCFDRNYSDEFKSVSFITFFSIIDHSGIIVEDKTHGMFPELFKTEFYIRFNTDIGIDRFWKVCEYNWALHPAFIDYSNYQ